MAGSPSWRGTRHCLAEAMLAPRGGDKTRESERCQMMRSPSISGPGERQHRNCRHFGVSGLWRPWSVTATKSRSPATPAQQNEQMLACDARAEQMLDNRSLACAVFACRAFPATYVSTCYSAEAQPVADVSARPSTAAHCWPDSAAHPETSLFDICGLLQCSTNSGSRCVGDVVSMRAVPQVGLGGSHGEADIGRTNEVIRTSLRSCSPHVPET